MPEIKITDRISCIPACEHPLSGDVGIVRGDRYTYIYDVGSTPETLEMLYSMNGQCDIVISHFHGDHTWWLTGHRPGEEGLEEGDTLSLTYERPAFHRLYIGAHTRKYIPDGEVITAPTIISLASGINCPAEERTVGNEPAQLYDGVKICVFPIPNSHCKGSLIMTVDDEYAFIGDSGYCMTKDGRRCYNAQLLKDEIELLKKLPVSKLLVSHDRKYIRSKDVVLRQLEAIYGRRTPDSPYIEVK